MHVCWRGFCLISYSRQKRNWLRCIFCDNCDPESMGMLEIQKLERKVVKVIVECKKSCTDRLNLLIEMYSWCSVSIRFFSERFSNFVTNILLKITKNAKIIKPCRNFDSKLYIKSTDSILWLQTQFLSSKRHLNQ